MRVSKFIWDAVADNRLLYLDKERSQQLRANPGVYFPNIILSVDFKRSIARYHNLVNSLYGDKIKPLPSGKHSIHKEKLDAEYNRFILERNSRQKLCIW